METLLQKKIDLKTKPLGSLGRLEKIAKQIGLIQNTLTPSLCNPAMLIFAGDHGLAEEGVSPFPKEVTYQMVMNFVGGGAAINVFCRQNGFSLKVVDAGVDFDFPQELNIVHAKVAHGTKNILKEPAMSPENCLLAMNRAARIVADEAANNCNVIGFGEMGIGNTSAASLIMHKIIGLPIDDCTGSGAGMHGNQLDHKKQVLAQAAKLYNCNTPLDILATYGGYEIAMMTGAMLEAAKRGMVLLVDGFIASASFLVAYKMNNDILKNAIFCHKSNEYGHKAIMDYLNAEPILDLGFRLGEGTGAAVAYPIIKSALAFLNEMASFEDAGVSNSSN
jgi:nicotinate-nucleotide--dimethylbenzimidazole phosphoribosyltransferase